MTVVTLLEAHLEQTSLCAASIADLPFPRPRIFTNALLHQHDVTALIRDTETHERALFSVQPPPTASRAQDSANNPSRRATVFNLNESNSGTNLTRAPRRNTAVAAVLGGDLVERIRRGGGGGVGTGAGHRTAGGREKGEVDVDVLLEGAEKLCGVYPIPGATEKIAQLRHRYSQLTSSIAHYETRVARQAAQLNRMNRPHDYEDDDDDETEATYPVNTQPTAAETYQLSEEDLRKEEDEIRELERKKRSLEDRVTGMERDLGGLMR
ncbi:DASH complex subunit Spc34 [Cryomyces antarcticus]